MLGHAAGNRISLLVENEPLRPGPEGARLAVVDYDGSRHCFYEPVNLDAPAVLMQGGLSPTESDPRFHQQMVYAVASKVLENFDQSLGRKFRFRGNRKLRLFPHAFQDENAFYEPSLLAVLFGYFRADETDPGPNLPGQTVFTCLSHDVVAHEVTHALVDRMRPHFLEPSNRDVFAFHEGFADIVAIFQHFTFPEVLTNAIQSSHANLKSSSALLDLARQFGYSTGMGQALRSAADGTAARDPLDPESLPAGPGNGDRQNPYETVTEPHERGSILVAAVFDAFFLAYQHRIKDLIRIATGGTGLLPAGDLHPDLVSRMAKEAAKSAQNVLTMCIRAFDYLPPVDVTFGDFLRALVTADWELVPSDDIGLRASMIEAFRVRGILPDHVASLAEESLLWTERSRDTELPRLPIDQWRENLLLSVQAFDRYDPRRAASAERLREADEELGGWALKLHDYAKKNAARLDLDPGRPIRLNGFHTVFRIGPDGQLLIELVAQFVQRRGRLEKRRLRRPSAARRDDDHRVLRRPDTLRSFEAAPLTKAPRARRASERRERQLAFVRRLTSGTSAGWGDDPHLKDRRLLQRRRSQRSTAASGDTWAEALRTNLQVGWLRRLRRFLSPHTFPASAIRPRRK